MIEAIGPLRVGGGSRRLGGMEDTWGDPFAILDAPRGCLSNVGRCAECRTEMIAGPGEVLPECCSVCETKEGREK